MRRWYDEEHGMKMCEPDCVDEWLFDIWAIGCDYDGCHSAKDLKKLVDELVDMAEKARECLWEWRLFGVHGNPTPKTNGDRYRAMSDEELAKIVMVKGCPKSKQFFTCEMAWNCEECWLDYLRQPVKDGEGE